MISTGLGKKTAGYLMISATLYPPQKNMVVTFGPASGWGSPCVWWWRHHSRTLVTTKQTRTFPKKNGVSKDFWIFFCFRKCAWLKNIHFTLPVSSNLASWNSWNIHHRMSSIVVHQKTSISVLLINTEIFEPQLNNGWWIVTNRMGQKNIQQPSNFGRLRRNQWRILL